MTDEKYTIGRDDASWGKIYFGKKKVAHSPCLANTPEFTELARLANKALEAERRERENRGKPTDGDAKRLAERVRALIREEMESEAKEVIVAWAAEDVNHVVTGDNRSFIACTAAYLLRQAGE